MPCPNRCIPQRHCRLCEINVVLGQNSGQRIVPIEVKLQPKRCPSGYAQIAQSQIRRYKIKIIMQALRCGWLDIGSVCLLVVPRLVAGTGLHCRKHMHQTRPVASIQKNLSNPFFLTKVVFPDKFDLDSCFFRKSLGIFPNLIAKRLRPFGVIENPDTLCVQVACHALGKTNTGNRSRYDNPVPAGQHACNFLL